MPQRLDDQRVRVAAFRWLDEQVARLGDVLPRPLLAEGFEIDGRRVPLLSRQGIFKPGVLPEIPLSITTTVHGPYKDQVSPGGLMFYSYRAGSPDHPDNAGLRRAMREGTPMVYFHAIVAGRYLAVWPVFIVGDDPGARMFRVAVDDRQYLRSWEKAEESGFQLGEPQGEGRRQYVTAVVLQRLHQRAFRERVLYAYRQQCALCLLRHAELLDAAHIIPDGEPGGEPVLQNGISLCKLHHAAFDGFFLGIRPDDYVIEVRNDILEERDGPMLAHGLQGLHGIKLLLPHSSMARPSQDRLEVVYRRFRET